MKGIDCLGLNRPKYQSIMLHIGITQKCNRALPTWRDGINTIKRDVNIKPALGCTLSNQYSHAEAWSILRSVDLDERKVTNSFSTVDKSTPIFFLIEQYFPVSASRPLLVSGCLSQMIWKLVASPPHTTPHLSEDTLSRISFFHPSCPAYTLSRSSFIHTLMEELAFTLYSTMKRFICLAFKMYPVNWSLHEFHKNHKFLPCTADYFALLESCVLWWVATKT